MLWLLSIEGWTRAALSCLQPWRRQLSIRVLANRLPCSSLWTKSLACLWQGLTGDLWPLLGSVYLVSNHSFSRHCVTHGADPGDTKMTKHVLALQWLTIWWTQLPKEFKIHWPDICLRLWNVPRLSPVPELRQQRQPLSGAEPGPAGLVPVLTDCCGVCENLTAG